MSSKTITSLLKLPAEVLRLRLSGANLDMSSSKKERATRLYHHLRSRPLPDQRRRRTDQRQQPQQPTSATPHSGVAEESPGETHPDSDQQRQSSDDLELEDSESGSDSESESVLYIAELTSPLSALDSTSRLGVLTAGSLGRTSLVAAAAPGRHLENRAATTTCTSITFKLCPLAVHDHAAEGTDGVDITNAPATGSHSSATIPRPTGTIAGLLFATPVPLVLSNDGVKSPAPANQIPRWTTVRFPHEKLTSTKSAFWRLSKYTNL